LLTGYLRLGLWPVLGVMMMLGAVVAVPLGSSGAPSAPVQHATALPPWLAPQPSPAPSSSGGGVSAAPRVVPGGSVTAPCCSVIKNPVVGDRPADMAVDSAANLIFVSNWGSGTVSVFSGTYPFIAVPWSPVNVGGVGAYPNGEAYDPNNCTVWVTLWSSGDIDEISDGATGPNCGGPATAGHIVRTISLGASVGPYGIAYDPEDQVMLVSDQGYGVTPQNVTVICAQASCSGLPLVMLPLSSNSWSGSYPATSLGPRDVAYDPVDDAFFVSNPTGSGTVSLTPEVDMFGCRGSCDIPANWYFETYSPLAVGSQPAGLVFAGTGSYGALSGGTGTVWVAEFGSDSVAVLCVRSTSQYPLGTPTCTAGSELQGYFSVPLASGSTPANVAFYPPCDELFVTGFGTDYVYIFPDGPSPPIAASLNVGVGPDDAVYDGAIFVSNYGQNGTTNGNGNVSVILCSMCYSLPCNYTATFNETGLPVGTTWDITLNGVTMSSTVTVSPTGGLVGTSITFSGLCIGSYSFSVSSPTGYVVTPSSGTITVPPGLAPGSEVYQTVTFAPVCQYTITFNETGLAPGSTWDVALNGVTMTVTVTVSAAGTTTGTNITFSGLCAGNYTFVISSPSGYTANPASGTVTIPPTLAPGSEVYQTIQFTKILPCSYTITFNETGLTPNLTWDVVVNGTTLKATVTASGAGTVITFTGLCAGKYPFIISVPKGWTATPGSGTIVIPAGLAPGSEVYQRIVFTNPCSYTVTFNETGLPPGLVWDVTLNGKTIKVTTTTTGGRSITFSGLCSGKTYPYKVSSPKGWVATPVAGKITIPVGIAPGSEVYQTIVFKP